MRLATVSPPHRSRRGLALAAPLAVLALAAYARAQDAPSARATQAPSSQAGAASPGQVFQQAGFDQRLGERIPLDLPLRDESGRLVRLGDFFGKRPVILSLVYFRCPMLCGQTLNSLTRSLRALPNTAGDTFEVLTISFDPNDTPARAARKKQSAIEAYDRARGGDGWHFLTGSAETIDALTRAVGFRYRHDPITDQYAHAAGIVVLAPDGLITRYFFGVDYPPKQLRESLDLAAGGQVESPVARLLMLCYDYNPATGRYTLAIVRILQILGTATALTLAGAVAFLIHRDRRQRISPSPP